MREIVSDSRGNFVAFAKRECGEHRTTGRRAWCLHCSEWCSPSLPCRGCELPALRRELENTRQALRKAVLAALDAHEDEDEEAQR